MIKTPYETGGFAFLDEAMMEKAVKEGEGIRYIANSADMRDPQMAYQVYCQMTEQQLFETPVGYVYLHGLQEYLKADPSIRNTDIPPIPVIVRTEGSLQKEARPEKKEPARRDKVKNRDYKAWFHASMTVCVILFLIVAGMFVIASTSGNINIVNYENALIEKYEVWETQLNEREEKLKEREQALSGTDALSEETSP